MRGKGTAGFTLYAIATINIKVVLKLQETSTDLLGVCSDLYAYLFKFGIIEKWPSMSVFHMLLVTSHTNVQSTEVTGKPVALSFDSLVNCHHPIETHERETTIARQTLLLSLSEQTSLWAMLITKFLLRSQPQLPSTESGSAALGSERQTQE